MEIAGGKDDFTGIPVNGVVIVTNMTKEGIVGVAKSDAPLMFLDPGGQGTTGFTEVSGRARRAGDGIDSGRVSGGGRRGVN